MKIIKADEMGLCFGVRDALQRADGVENPKEVTIHGQLVHNEQLLVQLEQRGFHMTDETSRESIPRTSQVMVTAHGVSDRERERLQRAGKRLIDTTCPLVRRVHEAARELEANGFHVLVIGQPEHVEVRGIVGDLADYDVIGSPEESRWFAADRLGIVCQTTIPSRDVERIRQAITEQNPHAEIHFVDTVCQPTKDRQAAIERLVRQVDSVVVVGGKNSNNTTRLAVYCRSKGVRAFHVQSADDLRAEMFCGCAAVGLTAGTSTLPDTIDAVHKRLTEIAEAQSFSPRSSLQWRDYFERNQRKLLTIPWEEGACVSEAERTVIARSVQEFQLGETGEGRHFLCKAADYAKQNGDDGYVEALRLFIAEEQRHAQDLGRFMDLSGIPRIGKKAVDTIFRRLRHAAGLDLTISVLLTAEIIAKVYYRALHDATDSNVLKVLCKQILRDESAHVCFQAERLAILRREWFEWKKVAARLLQRILFDGTALIVWRNHGSVLRAGGFSFGRYWRVCRREFASAMRLVNWQTQRSIVQSVCNSD